MTSSPPGGGEERLPRRTSLRRRPHRRQSGELNASTSRETIVTIRTLYRRGCDYPNNAVTTRFPPPSCEEM